MIDERIKKFADEAEPMDVVETLQVLTKRYVDFCGISASLRTIVYECAEMWFARLREMTDHPLSAAARKTDYLFEFMPIVSAEYDPAVHDDYDIRPLDDDVYLECINDFLDDEYEDDLLKRALCWGYVRMHWRHSETQ